MTWRNTIFNISRQRWRLFSWQSQMLNHNFYRSFISLKRNEMKEMIYYEVVVRVWAPPLGADGKRLSLGEGAQWGGGLPTTHWTPPQG